MALRTNWNQINGTLKQLNISPCFKVDRYFKAMYYICNIRL